MQSPWVWGPHMMYIVRANTDILLYKHLHTQKSKRNIKSKVRDLANNISKHAPTIYFYGVWSMAQTYLSATTLTIFPVLKLPYNNSRIWRYLDPKKGMTCKKDYPSHRSNSKLGKHIQLKTSCEIPVWDDDHLSNLLFHLKHATLSLI